MTLTLKTPRQADLIVSSLRKVFTTGNIDFLTNAAYKFLYLSSGFIAHYDINGFKDNYASVKDLEHDICMNHGANQWRNFRPIDRDYEYNMQKKEIYNRIRDLIPDVRRGNGWERW